MFMSVDLMYYKFQENIRVFKIVRVRDNVWNFMKYNLSIIF